LALDERPDDDEIRARIARRTYGVGRAHASSDEKRTSRCRARGTDEHR
jgi:hypothetical protein